MGKCFYCSKQGTEDKVEIKAWDVVYEHKVELNYCSEKCKEEVQKFVSYNSAKRTIIFTILVVLSFISEIPIGYIAISTFVSNHDFSYVPLVLAPPVLAICGLLVIPKYPIGVLIEILKYTGVKRFVLVQRILGVLGLAIYALYLFMFYKYVV